MAGEADRKKEDVGKVKRQADRKKKSKTPLLQKLRGFAFQS
jgi:hypothetical protein